MIFFLLILIIIGFLFIMYLYLQVELMEDDIDFLLTHLAEINKRDLKWMIEDYEEKLSKEVEHE